LKSFPQSLLIEVLTRRFQFALKGVFTAQLREPRRVSKRLVMSCTLRQKGEPNQEGWCNTKSDTRCNTWCYTGNTSHTPSNTRSGVRQRSAGDSAIFEVQKRNCTSYSAGL